MTYSARNMQEDIENRVRKDFPDADVVVALEGNRATIAVTSERFEGVSRVQRQQAVYACIQEYIADGRLHAVTIRAQPPG